MQKAIENKTLEDIRIGDQASLKRTLPRRDLHLWSALTGNPGFDERFVAAHGVTTWASSLFATVIGSTLPGPGTVIRTANIAFHRAVHVGDEITATVTVKEVRESSGEVILDCTCADGAGAVVASGTITATAPAEKVRIERPPQALDELLDRCRDLEPLRTAVVHPCSADALAGAIEAAEHRLIEPILFAPLAELRPVAAELRVDLSKFQVVDTLDAEDSAAKAAALAGSGDAKALMKGSLHTDQYVHAIIAKEHGLRTNRLLSHAFLLWAPTYGRRIIISDAAVMIAPDVDQKRDIIQNAIILARAIGIEQPKVAILSAVEVVRTKMPSTMDASALAKMADRNQIVGGIVDGPLDLDIAVDAESARIKGVSSPIAGAADILIAPDIDAGNMMYKELTFMSDAQVAGIVMGAKVPVILTSRSDSTEARMFSAALAVLFAEATVQDPTLLHPKTSE